MNCGKFGCIGMFVVEFLPKTQSFLYEKSSGKVEYWLP